MVLVNDLEGWRFLPLVKASAIGHVPSYGLKSHIVKNISRL